MSDAFLIRPIEPRDDAAIAAIIRAVMPEFGADGPGFAIHDAEVDAMCALGSPAKAARSACRPGATRPNTACWRRIFAATSVAACSACAGVMPSATIAAGSRQFSPCANTPTSLPLPIVTPSFSAVRNACADSCMAGVGADWPGT